MIIWICGPSGAGKTTLAGKIIEKYPDSTIWLDGDLARKSISSYLGYDESDRELNNLTIANIAKKWSDKGFNVVVSAITPYDETRKKIMDICDPLFIRVDHKGSKGRDDDAKFEELDDPLKFNIQI